ncbi:hypothetical protein BDV25DRAFT_141738 [Aspergillus avenaceus]|uniref:Uncharacterized protein n=1 Tax=Aspergillus avenaceus TaxID=36643 RepID=A0A5N6TQF6_ASPAV|nr:hypothetical protein BDV25DRAFT_141738 [Aspergillus avenaceus]
MSTEESTVSADAAKEPCIEELFRMRHITYLQHIVRQSAITKEQNMYSMTNYIQSHESKLQSERNAHVQTIKALELEKRLRLEAITTLTRNHYELLAYRAAQSAFQLALDIERKRGENMALELERTQKKFFLVDTLVDYMLLEEDSQLDLSDRSRQITDVILDLENKMEARYRSMLQERDETIFQLRRALGNCEDQQENSSRGHHDSESE